MIDTSKEVIKIKLTSPSGEVRETKVYTNFTMDAHSRVVQAICDLVGGTVVYFRFRSDSGKYTTVPVHDRRSPIMIGDARDTLHGSLATLESMFNERGHALTVFGESRIRWSLTAESADESNTELDYGPEHSDDLPSGITATDGDLVRRFYRERT